MENNNGRRASDAAKEGKKMEMETRLIRMSLLARPHPKRFVPDPDPRLYFVGERKVSLSALIYRPTKRILLLAKYCPRIYTPKFVKPPPREHWVNPESLEFRPTPRLLELAEPSKKSTMKPKKKKSKKREQKRLKKIKDFMENRPEWLKLRAAPKEPPPQPKLLKIKPTGEELSPEERNERINQMAIPKHMFALPEEAPQISRAALKYVPSKRMLEMAGPKELDPETVLNLTFNPYKIKKAALHYKASPRILEMATPNIRKKQEDTDVKENPFAILPRALTAICTKRVAELAKPIERD